MGSVVPSSSSERSTATGVVAGALLGSLARPLTWPIGPVRLGCYALATAASESDYGSAQVGDGGTSIGILQWRGDTIAAIGFGGREGRPVDEGRALAAEISYAIRSRPSWVVLYLPIVGYAYLRLLWTHGIETDKGLGTALGLVASEADRGTAAYALARLVTALPAAYVAGYILGRAAPYLPGVLRVR